MTRITSSTRKCSALKFQALHTIELAFFCKTPPARPAHPRSRSLTPAKRATSERRNDIMAIEVLSGAFLKLRRARERLAELRKFVPDRSFLGRPGDLQRALGYNGYSDGFSFYLQNNENEGTTYLTIKAIEDKEVIQCLVGEIVYHLRSSLDHAVVSLAKLNSPGHSTKSAYFPICERPDDLLSSKKISLLSDKAREAIIKLRPHKGEGGNSLLILLNDLRNLDAHLEVVSISHGGVGNYLRINPLDPLSSFVIGPLAAKIMCAQMDEGKSSLSEGVTVPYPLQVPEEEHEHVLSQLYQSLALSMFLAIDSVPDCEDKPMVPLLCTLADEVEQALQLLAKHAWE